ncbi:MFS transporter [Corticimicrobacter populi]|uniref:MFS transporter n=1 Tax=Corticimicrobacter populi TaxID=2175229 RepID=A0A2V1K3J8_9BURK|nr:MFS transporter [Corticimicrobacter populi]PWF25160.1 MFS transporter [Corticimicrobacter populi]QDQ87102.1 MFS transporter [Alcaligenaceae bacterium SJ-26]
MTTVNKLPAPLLAKISWRLLPFLLLMYIMAFLDRANVGFAKVAYQADTGISDAAFALGAGIFFLGYALLEVPSNLIMHRVGARMWMCRIMVSWGLISAAMMFAHNETIFYVLRFALGVAEAGFFPGVILYLTYWFPAAHRAQAMGFFYFGAPLAFIFGSPLSGLLLDLNGAGGLHGWQWMFMVEGLLATAVGIWAYFYLTNHPRDAAWLTQAERDLVSNMIAAENSSKGQHGHNLLAAMTQPRVLYLALIYLLIQASVYGVVFYLPSQVAGLLGTKVGLTVGIVSAIPWVCALLAAWLIPGWADRTQRHARIASLTLVMSALGMAASVSVSSPALAIIALCFAAAGFIAVQPVFWTFPSNMLAGTAAAGGIALINSFGAVGGFVAPIVKNWTETVFQSQAAGLYLLAGTTVLAAFLVLQVRAHRTAA